MNPTFLPYDDALRGLKGWQFGVTGNGKSPSISILLEDGSNWTEKTPIVTSPNTKRSKPGLPQWAWAVIANDDGTANTYKVSAPLKPYNPVSDLPFRELPAWHGEDIETDTHMSNECLTPAGLVYATSMMGRAPAMSPSDLRRDVTIDNEYQSGVLVVATIKLGVTEVCRAVISGHYVLSFIPSQVAYELNLWTSHLVDATLVTYTP